MLTFVIRRILISVPVLLAATLLIHLCLVLSGNPLDDLLQRNPRPSPQVIAQESHLLHYDKGFFERYLIWLKGLFTGTFGVSTRQLDIGSALGRALEVTLRMVIGAMILAVIFAVLAGVVSAIKQYTPTDYSVTFAGFLFLSMPAFWFAALLKTLGVLSNEHLGTKIDTIGENTPNVSSIGDSLSHAILPIISLALISFASWSRFQRASMLEVLSSDYVRLARAKGLSRGRVLVRHALRTALIALTTVVAIDVGAIFGGAVVTESVFAWNGMGSLLTDAVRARDVNVVLAWLLVSGLFVIVANLVADVLYAALDPRIRYS